MSAENSKTNKRVRTDSISEKAKVKWKSAKEDKQLLGELEIKE